MRACAHVDFERAMRIIFVAVLPALLCAGISVAQGDDRRDPRDARAKVLPVEYRSAFDGYRQYADPELRDWRRSNEEVGAAGGRAGDRPGPGPGGETSKPRLTEPAPQDHREHK
jgi:hypothetical protein